MHLLIQLVREIEHLPGKQISLGKVREMQKPLAVTTM